MGQNFTHSVDQLLTLSPQYVMVTYLTHGGGEEGWGVTCKGRGSVDKIPRVGRVAEH